MNTGRKTSEILFIVFLAILGLIPLIWPGDAPWINDEPRLIQIALDAHRTGDWPSHGLWGSRGFQYGPFPAWTYTAALYAVDDLIDLVRLKTFLTVVLTAAAIFWLARSIPFLNPWIGSVAFLSPYLWFYSRILWDNVFLIPLSALTVAAYVSFCVAARAWKLWIVALGMTCLFLTHLMSVAVIAPILIHAAVFYRVWLGQHKRILLAQFAAATILSAGYLRHLLTTSPAAVSAHTQSIWRGWLFPFLGGEFFSAFGIDYFFGADWYVSGSPWVVFFGIFTWIAVGVTWMGMAEALRRIRDGIVSAAARDGSFHMSLLAVSALGTQCILDGVCRTYGHPHYFNATWVFFLYCFWLALSLANSPSAQAPLPIPMKLVYVASMGIVLGFLILNVHHSGGTRTVHYGAPIQNQIELARILNTYYPDSKVVTDVANYTYFPHALAVIRNFYGLAGTDTGPVRSLQIRYQDPDGRSGWLTVQERSK